MESSLSADLITRSLNFHGQQLQKLWEGERGEGDFAKIGVNSKDLEFAVYQQRQKHLSFQDRGKRLKLQQFIVKKATALFDSTLLETGEIQEKVVGDEDFYAVLPPYETFLSLDKQRRVQLFYQRLKRGDIIIGSILLKSVMGSSMTLRLLCTDGENARCVSDLSIKAMCPTANTVPAVDKKGTRTYLINDTVCCEVLEVKADSEKIVVGMKGVTLPPNSEYASRLGLIHSDDFPEVYNMYKTMQSKSIT